MAYLGMAMNWFCPVEIVDPDEENTPEDEQEFEDPKEEHEDEDIFLAKLFLPGIDEVIFNEEGRATVIIWSDGKKTVVRCGQGESFDRYTGFMAAVCKRLFGSTSSAKKLMNDLDYGYQRKLQKEQEEKDKAERQQQAQAEQKKAENRQEKEFISAMKSMILQNMMQTVSKSLAEELLKNWQKPEMSDDDNG